MHIFLHQQVLCEFDKTAAGNSAAIGKCVGVDDVGISVKLDLDGRTHFIQWNRVSHLSMD